MDCFVSLAIETSGFSYIDDRILEICAIRYAEGLQTDSFHSLVKPEVPIGDGVYEITGISRIDLELAPFESEVMRGLADFLDEARGGMDEVMPIVLYDAQFDGAFVNASFKRTGIKYNLSYVDLIKVVGKQLDCLNDGKKGSRKLSAVAERLGIETHDEGDRMTDAESWAVAEALLIGEVYIKLNPHSKR